MKYCPQCGNPAEDFSELCTNCGSALLMSGPIAAASTESAPESSAEIAEPTFSAEPASSFPQETVPPPPEPVSPYAPNPLEPPVGQSYTAPPPAGDAPMPPPAYGAPPPTYDAPPPPPPVYGVPLPGFDAPSPGYNPPPPGYSQPGFSPPPLAESSAVSVFKKIASSGLFLTAVLTFTASLVLNFVTAFLPGPNPLEMLGALEEIGLPEEWMDAFWDGYYNNGGGVPSSAGVDVMSTLFGMIPSIILCIGLWNVYSAGRSKTPFVRTGGLSMARGVTIFTLVGMCILPLILLIAGVACLAIAGELSGEESVLLMVIGVVCLVCILFMVLPILYYAFLSSTIKSIRVSLITGSPFVKVSRFVIVINFITAVSSLFSLLSSVSFMGSMGLSGGAVAVSVLSTVCSGLFTVTLTIALMRYKTEMKNAQLQQSMQMGGYASPGFPPPPPGFAPPPPGFPPPPPPQYTNPYDVYQPQSDPYQTASLPTVPPAQPGEYVFCHVCSKQYASGTSFCPHCGAARNP